MGGILQFVTFGLGNGEPTGLLYSYLAALVGFTLVQASMAEMASMAPTSGSQYHWVCGFAPRGSQKMLSYFVGWLGVLGYQVGIRTGTLWSGTAFQGLMILIYPSSQSEDGTER